MITIDKLKKNFGEKVAVDIEHYEINQGDMLGLVGNNGAGKTTLFRLMLDLLKADDGKVIINDIDVSQSEDWKSITGAFIDDGFLIDYLTPEEYFYFIGKMYGLKKEEVDERLVPFERFMSGEVIGHKKLIRNYSAGNKQKIGIISAMLHYPQLLILDEPFNFLDPSSQSIIKHLLKKYNEEHGITPQTIKKAVRDLIAISKAAEESEEDFKKEPESMDARELDKLAKELSKKMRQAAAELNFEEAARLRDRMKEVRQMLFELESEK